jgi:uncharacterized protein YdbL (DUF1318 family)
MTTRRTFIAIICALLISPAWLSAATQDDIIARQKKRAAQLQELKADGTIGETDAGYVEFVTSASRGEEVVQDENADRRELYALVAKDAGTTPEDVAKHAAQKIFQRAKKGDYLKYAGKWRRKA